MIKKISWILINLFLLSSLTFSQQKYEFFIEFKDKLNNGFSIDAPQDFLSERAIERRNRQQIEITEQDLPVSGQYITYVKNNGATVLHQLKWFNGLIIQADSTTFLSLLEKPYITHGELIGEGLELNAKSKHKNGEYNRDYGLANSQIKMLGADLLHEESYFGEGIFISIIDGGFNKLDQLNAFSALRKSGRLKFTYDVPLGDTIQYNKNVHGMAVASTIFADFEDGGFGIAPKADLAIFRSEVVSFEQPIEEYFWIVAAEKSDSLGVDIINSSLGYSQFDDGWPSHIYADLDGNTTMITKAADIASSKGMLVVVSAGNSGTDPWYYILAPADADSVLTVGAVYSNESYASFSSKGPTFDDRIKPEVVAQGGGAAILIENGQAINSNGTSFSAPIISGFAALLWQKNRTFTAMELRNYIIGLGNNEMPDNFTGYGIPKYKNVTGVFDNEFSETEKLYPNPVSDKLYYEGKGAYQLSSIQGNVIEKGFCNGEISTEKLDAGSYFLLINNVKYLFIKL